MGKYTPEYEEKALHDLEQLNNSMRLAMSFEVGIHIDILRIRIDRKNEELIHSLEGYLENFVDANNKFSNLVDNYEDILMDKGVLPDILKNKEGFTVITNLIQTELNKSK